MGIGTQEDCEKSGGPCDTTTEIETRRLTCSWSVVGDSLDVWTPMTTGR